MSQASQHFRFSQTKPLVLITLPDIQSALSFSFTPACFVLLTYSITSISTKYRRILVDPGGAVVYNLTLVGAKIPHTPVDPGGAAFAAAVVLPRKKR